MRIAFIFLIVLRMNFPNGALWQSQQLRPTLASLARTVCHIWFKLKMTTVRPWKAPTCSVLGFDFVLHMVSFTDATCWNAVVVVLTWRKMKSFKPQREISSFFFSFLKALYVFIASPHNGYCMSHEFNYDCTANWQKKRKKRRTSLTLSFILLKSTFVS